MDAKSWVGLLLLVGGTFALFESENVFSYLGIFGCILISISMVLLTKPSERD